MEQQIEYINQGRGGYVVYKDTQSAIKFDFEFGGGNCVAIIFVPTPTQWTSATKRPVTDREAILTFVAERAIKDQAPGCYYKLSDNYIEILSKTG